MRNVNRCLAVTLSYAVALYAQGNTFTKVRYNGGSVASKVDAKSWDNKLTVAPDSIVLQLKDSQRVEILPKSVTSLSYGQEAHRRVGTMIALAVLIAPVALFGLFHKTRLHFIGVQYTTPDGKPAGILLQGDKDNYRAMLVALQGVTGAPVSVSDKEREFVPVGLTANVTKGTDQSKGAPSSGETTGTVSVATNPDGADVYLDDQFVGNSPATLKLTPGKHSICVRMSGYKDWSREIASEIGTAAHLTANLEK